MNLSHKSIAELETELRELCCWYEWSEPPRLHIACVLQDAADAVRVHALSVVAAEALIAAWQPFAGLEAHVGNPPAAYTVAHEEGELRKSIIGDIRRMVANESDPARRLRLASLLNQQIRNLKGVRQ